MKYAPLFAALCLIATPALAAATTAKAPVATANLTATEAKKICDFRWSGDADKTKTCMDRHQTKVGQPKTTGDSKTLDDIAAAKATKKTTTSKKTTKTTTTN